MRSSNLGFELLTRILGGTNFYILDFPTQTEMTNKGTKVGYAKFITLLSTLKYMSIWNELAQKMENANVALEILAQNSSLAPFQLFLFSDAYEDVY